MLREPLITLVLLYGYYGAIIWDQTRIVHGSHHNANLRKGDEILVTGISQKLLYRVPQNLVSLFFIERAQII